MSNTKLSKAALKGFVGTRCVTCKRQFENLDDVLKNLFWIGWGRVQCKECHDKEKK